ncbi:MAG TPA: hypothetical protein VIM12_06480 [Noviherbaspirillum sp.]|jgi:hypothetical protein|uniref:hypothetical protein n=1 Tax=Noviherbaspirillum sp. TaxID=1926288 RepID=UPI002F952EAD
MDQSQQHRRERQAGADAIAARAVEIGRECGVDIARCTWDLGQDFGLQHAHRLDLFAETKTARLYFSDIELTTPGNDMRAKRIEERLRSAVAQLLAQPPAPTYAFK